jgi:hypothetical protein
MKNYPPFGMLLDISHIAKTQQTSNLIRLSYIWLAAESQLLFYFKKRPHEKIIRATIPRLIFYLKANVV